MKQPSTENRNDTMPMMMTGQRMLWKVSMPVQANEMPTAFKNVKPGESVMWHVPDDSRLMMGGERIAGTTLRLTKVKGRRSWIHQGLWATRVPTKYVDPRDCEMVS